MIPIPDNLKEIAVIKKHDEDSLTLSIKCSSCGGSSFVVYEDFDWFEIIKLVCEDCGHEYILFDSRFNGYDGIITERSADESEYVPQFRKKTRKAVGVEVWIENDSSLEDFMENSGGELKESDYPNAYTWMTVRGIYTNGRKRELYDIETS